MRLRPENPDELDLVDWRGRWIDDNDHYEDDEEQIDEDRPMEDFDPVSLSTNLTASARSLTTFQDAQDDDDEEEEEEEEEANDSVMQGRSVSTSFSALRSPTPTNPPDSPASTGPPQTPRDDAATKCAALSVPPSGGKLRVVRQWIPRGASARAQVC